MSVKFFEVVVTATRTVVIGVPDDYAPDNKDRSDVAQDIAMTEAFQFVSEKEVVSCEALDSQEDIDSATAHADEVL
ncbi:hypothetical protein ACEK07_45935 [Alcanivoracaceae bacterium MT1]